jgi:hypothetical protein
MRTILTAMVLVIGLCSAACTHVQPWQRGKLAHPTMASDFGGPASEHVYAVQEGAAGGGSGAESGCGCN